MRKPFIRRPWVLSLLLLGGCSVATAQIIKIPLRYAVGPGATTFYAVPSGGVTSGYRCTLAAPCNVQYAIDLAQAQYDVQGFDLTISIAAGTYSRALVVSGPLAGYGAVSGQNLVGAALVLRGAGSGSTIVNVTDCSAGQHALSVGGGAYVKLAGIKLQTACVGGADILMQQTSTVRLDDGDVNLGPASYALVFGFDRSTFIGNSTYGLKISGGATYGFALSTMSSAILSAGAVNTITGTPNFSAFVNLIDGSFFDIGYGSSFSGSATGVRYSMNLNSYIDMENQTAPLPGNAQGNVANGSYIFNNTGNLGTCVGGAVGCPVATAPTGLDGSAAIVAGSGDSSGVVAMTAGAAAAASGVIHVATPSVVAGPGHQGGFCTAALWASGAAWNARATVQPYYIAGDLVLNWDNNAVALTNGSTYAISYTCS